MPQLRLSQRVLRDSESPTMAVGRKAGELRARGVELFDLGAGEPSIDSPTAAVDAAIEALRAGHTRYTAIDGLADLRIALARRHNRGCEVSGPAEDQLDRGKPEPCYSGDGDVLVTVGAKAALLQAMMALVDPGSEVVIPAPCWMTLPSQVRLAGGTPILVPMDGERGFELEAQPLLDAITPQTRAVLLNSPCNPTGAVLSAQQMRLLAAGCAERDVVLVSDETYRAFVYSDSAPAEAELSWSPPTSVASLAREFPNHLLLVSAFSKSHAMTGWRVGYALGPEHLIGAMRSVQSHATSNATSFAMHGALVALEQEDAYVVEHVRHCARNREIVSRLLTGAPRLDYSPPEGAFYAFPAVDLSAMAVDSTAQLAEKLLEEHRVVVVPGEAFGAPGRLRISFAGDAAVVEEGLRRLVSVVSG